MALEGVTLTTVATGAERLAFSWRTHTPPPKASLVLWPQLPGTGAGDRSLGCHHPRSLQRPRTRAALKLQAPQNRRARCPRSPRGGAQPRHGPSGVTPARPPPRPGAGSVPAAFACRARASSSAAVRITSCSEPGAPRRHHGHCHEERGAGGGGGSRGVLGGPKAAAPRRLGRWGRTALLRREDNSSPGPAGAEVAVAGLLLRDFSDLQTPRATQASRAVQSRPPPPAEVPPRLLRTSRRWPQTVQSRKPARGVAAARSAPNPSPPVARPGPNPAAARARLAARWRSARPVPLSAADPRARLCDPEGPRGCKAHGPALPDVN